MFGPRFHLRRIQPCPEASASRPSRSRRSRRPSCPRVLSPIHLLTGHLCLQPGVQGTCHIPKKYSVRMYSRRASFPLQRSCIMVFRPAHTLYIHDGAGWRSVRELIPQTPSPAPEPRVWKDPMCGLRAVEYHITFLPVLARAGLQEQLHVSNKPGGARHPRSS